MIRGLLIGFMVGMVLCAGFYVFELGYDKVRPELQNMDRDELIDRYSENVADFYCPNNITSCKIDEAVVVRLVVDNTSYTVFVHGRNIQNTVCGRKSFVRLFWVP